MLTVDLTLRLLLETPRGEQAGECGGQNIGNGARVTGWTDELSARWRKSHRQ
jgi:hypothetical protein